MGLLLWRWPVPRRSGAGAAAAPAAGAADAASPAGKAPYPPLLWSAAVAVALTAVYIWLTPPVSGDKDGSEFVLVLHYLGLAHPTGYPLYTVLGHLFVRALGALGASPQLAANLWSAAGGGVAVCFLHALAARLPGRDAALGRAGRFWVALPPALLFALNPIWTFEATLAEVYSWHGAWVAGTAVCFLRLMRADAGAWPAARLCRHGALWGALCGVGGAHHATALLIAAPLTLALAIRLATLRRLRPAAAATVVLGALVPLASYGFVLYRVHHPAAVHWLPAEPTWEGTLRHIGATNFRFMMGRFQPSPWQEGFLARFVFPLLWPGLLLLGAAVASARGGAERLARAGLVAAAGLQTLHAFRYGVFDPSSYFLPVMLLGSAAAAGVAGDLAGRRRARRAGLAAVLALGVVAGVVAAPWLRVAVNRRDGFVRFDALVHRMWASITFERAIVLYADDMWHKLREYQLLRQEKPELAVYNTWLLSYPRVRASFQERFGFDPMTGVPLPRVADLIGPDSGRRLLELKVALEDGVNARTSLPVIVMDPSVPSVRLLRKDGPLEGTAAAGAHNVAPP